MRDEQLAFLRRLTGEIGPSGFEADAARVWRQEAGRFADEVTHDAVGNSYAWLRGPEGAPVVAVEGHIDEIGFQVTHVDDGGFLWVGEIGGWDASVVVSQRITFRGRQGSVTGVVGRKAPHLTTQEERDKAPKLKDLWVDIGASSREDALAKVRPGDYGVLEAPWLALTDDLVVSRAMDDRTGAWVALSALERLAGERPAVSVVAMAATREEISFAGAITAAFSVAPAAAVVVDVCHATDYPESDKRRHGDIKLGGGPAIASGSSISPVISRQLMETAERIGMPFAYDAQPSATWTDADGMVKAGRGVPCGVVSVPLRYMHSPNETVSLGDVDACAELIAQWVRGLPGEVDFRP